MNVGITNETEATRERLLSLVRIGANRIGHWEVQ